ncbi:hypothetical protein HR11_06645 [Porphyromonas macacae]|uniref:hypothetical protein n=1 Tax=Porphyromonas macacae TaxID=28115 RepID=UPI00052BCC62|nr:hypothetical protein [Porphyromonas macacae]KGN99877.1 hypothetical protein HR11_06645 [Porphyromonas macacae]
MKTCRLIVLLMGIALMAAMTAKAQDSREYKKIMNAKVEALEVAPLSGFLDLAADFERIAENPESDWIAAYYSAYCRIVYALRTPAKAYELCEEADLMLKKSEEKNGDHSEIACLRNMSATARMMVDPQSRWERWGAEAEKQLQTAMAINPVNPRAFLLKAQSLMYTPAQFGGGIDKALPYMKKCLELFGQEESVSGYVPHWGAEMAKKLFSEYLSKDPQD